MTKMNQKFCQCCGMPMGDTDELYGTNGDGNKNEEYRSEEHTSELQSR